jgi:hypothetical protein
MEISDLSPSGENNPSAPTVEEELRIINRRLQEQADQLRALNQELVDREARLRLSVETGRVGIWLWDASGSVHTLDWSRWLKEIFGLTVQSVPEKGTTISVVLPLVKYTPLLQL